MTKSYTRQSSFSNGDVIDAPLFNAEFDQLVEVFKEDTGHNHDGTAAGGAPVPFIQKGDSGVYVDTNDPQEPKIKFTVGGLDVFSISSATIADTSQINHVSAFGQDESLQDYLNSLGDPGELIRDANQLTHTPVDTGVEVMLDEHLDDVDSRIEGLELLGDFRDFGLGGAAIYLDSSDDINDIIVGGIYRWESDVPLNAPEGLAFCVMFVGSTSSGRAVQKIILRSASEVREWTRTLAGGAWREVEIYHSGNSVNPLDHGLGTNGVIVSDLNTISESGFYRVSGGGSNQPIAGSAFEVIHSTYDGNSAVQLAFRAGTGVVSYFVRKKAGGNWNDWAEVYTSANSVNPLDFGYGTANTETVLDLNDIDKTSVFRANNTTSNRPQGGSSLFTVFTMAYSDNAATQFAIKTNSINEGMWYRVKASGVWLDWIEVFTSDNSVNPLDFGLGDDGLPEFNVNQTNKTGFYNEGDTGRVNIVAVRTGTRAFSFSARANATGLPEARITHYNPTDGTVFYDERLKTGSLTVVSTSGDIVRTGAQTEVVVDTGVDVTLNLVASDFIPDDEIVITKLRQPKNLTITSDANIALPDNAGGSSHTLSEGYTGVIKIIKRGSNFRLSIVGGAA